MFQLLGRIVPVLYCRSQPIWNNHVHPDLFRQIDFLETLERVENISCYCSRRYLCLFLEMKKISIEIFQNQSHVPCDVR